MSNDKYCRCSNPEYVRYIDNRESLTSEFFCDYCDKPIGGSDMLVTDPDKHTEGADATPKSLKEILKRKYSMTYICGFFAVNQDHCWINGHCCVCGTPKVI